MAKSSSKYRITKKLNFKIETIASLTAILISLGTIFYHAIVVKRDVEHLTIKLEKTEPELSKIVENEKAVYKLIPAIEHNGRNVDKLEAKFEKVEQEFSNIIKNHHYNGKKLKNLDEEINKIQAYILESSQETKTYLLKLLTNEN